MSVCLYGMALFIEKCSGRTNTTQYRAEQQYKDALVFHLKAWTCELFVLEAKRKALLTGSSAPGS